MKKIPFFLMSAIVLGVAVWLILSLIAFNQPAPATESDLEESVEEEPPAEEESIVPSTSEVIEDEIPELNPTANTNPFSGAYKNPFE